MSVTDELSSRVMNKAEESASQVIKNLPNVPGKVIRGGQMLASGTVKTVSGICLVISAPFLTAKAVMEAAGTLTHNPKYSKNNISIESLEKNSDIKKMDDGLTKDVMKYFDAGCKKYGITYNAVVDKSKPREPTYYVFFKGKETAVIEQVMKESYEKFVKEQAKPRFSVRAKLAFFRDRVADRDREQQDLGKEKHNNRADRQR